MKTTKKQREFWKHNINPITGFKVDSQFEAEYIEKKESRTDFKRNRL